MPHLSFSRETLSSADRPAAGRLAVLLVLVLSLAAVPARAQAPGGGSDLSVHIGNLSSLDYQTRMNAARQIRRAPAAEAVAMLSEAVAGSRDEFVRYRAFILLSSFNDRSMSELARTLLRDRNDRLREAAYKWLEAHPDPALTATLLTALQTEQAEFVRPALVGALAAVDGNPQVQRALTTEVGRGVDFFRSAVIDVLGRHGATYAVDAIAAVAKLEGPLQDDAVLALGRIGGPRARAVLGALESVSSDVDVTIRAAQCLAGEACESSLEVLADTATAAGASVANVRTAVGGIAAIAEGNDAATRALVDLGGQSGTVRDHAALGLAATAVRNPDYVIAWLDAAPVGVRDAAIALLKDGFEDLEEDFGEEQFFAAARASYWKAAEGSSSRTLSASLIQTLDF